MSIRSPGSGFRLAARGNRGPPGGRRGGRPSRPPRGPITWR